MKVIKSGLLGLLVFFTCTAGVWAEEDTQDAPEPFKPSWTEQVSFTYSGNLSSLGQGQQVRELGFTVTNTLSESGHFISLGITGGDEIVESVMSNYGKVSLGGGLGLGFISPSAALQGQKGESALNSVDASLACSFKFYSALSLELAAGGGLESHQGPVSAILGTSDNINEVDSQSYSFSAASSFQAFDFLSFTLTAGRAYSQTYRYQNLSRSFVKDIDRTSREDSLSLETVVSFQGGLDVQLSGEIGQEIDPAGTFYSPNLGKTVNFSQPTTQNITGYTITLAYSFE